MDMNTNEAPDIDMCVHIKLWEVQNSEYWGLNDPNCDCDICKLSRSLMVARDRKERRRLLRAMQKVGGVYTFCYKEEEYI